VEGAIKELRHRRKHSMSVSDDREVTGASHDLELGLWEGAQSLDHRWKGGEAISRAMNREHRDFQCRERVPREAS
jgi:hypothetical protein